MAMRGSQHMTESLVGLGVVLAVLAIVAFGVLGGRGGGVPTAMQDGPDGYRVHARFGDIGGLPEGASVFIAGVAVGRVTDISVDPITLAVTVEIGLGRRHALPADSEIAVASGGIFGGKFVEIRPGSAGDTIPPGGRIEMVDNYKSLEEQVAEVAFGGGL